MGENNLKQEPTNQGLNMIMMKKSIAKPQVIASKNVYKISCDILYNLYLPMGVRFHWSSHF